LDREKAKFINLNHHRYYRINAQEQPQNILSLQNIKKTLRLF
jgi:hypothetical protein